MNKFYVTTKEISKAFGFKTYKASNLFKKVKQLHLETNTPLVDRSTVSTRLLCEYLKISQTDFTENIKKVSDKRDLNNNKEIIT